MAHLTLTFALWLLEDHAFWPVSVFLQPMLVGWVRNGIDSEIFVCVPSLALSCICLKTPSYFLGLLIGALPPLFLKKCPDYWRL